MKASNYNVFVHYEPDNVYIGYNCVSGGLYVFSDQQFSIVKEFLYPGKFPTCDGELIKEILLKGRFLIDDDWDELNALKLRNNITRYNSIQNALIITPTLLCSFDCPYCYVDREKVTMDRKTITSLMNFFKKKIVKSNGFAICWTGGEPTLPGAIDIVEELNSYFLMESQKSNVSFNSRMMTNGYSLSLTMVNRLKCCGIKTLQITIDGYREYHDRFRYRLGGGKTYDTIMNNVIMASKEGMHIILRANINKDNIEGIYKLLDDLAEKIENKENFVFSPCMVKDVKKSKEQFSCNVFTNSEFALLEPRILLYSAKKGFKVNKRVLSTLGSFCGANIISTYVIDAHGNILKCWCNLGRGDSNKIGVIEEDGEIRYTDYNNLCKWMSWDPFAINECIKCNVLPLCMGGCMYHNIMKETDSIDTGCSLRKHNLEEILKVCYLCQTKDIVQLEKIWNFEEQKKKKGK